MTKIKSKFLLYRASFFNEAEFRYNCLFLFSFLLMLSSFLFNNPIEIAKGLGVIIISPSHLLTDYMAIAGVGAALFNAGLIMYVSIWMVRRNKIIISGAQIAAIFTVSGFALFGKNLFNSAPIILGVYIYAKLSRVSFATVILPALFGTALSPLVSCIAFGMWLNLAISIPLSVLAGILVGLVIPPLSTSFIRFHQGYSLYNVGFTAGIIGMILNGFLRTFSIGIDQVYIVHDEPSLKLNILIYVIFISIIVLGFFVNKKSLKGYGHLLKQSGRLISDFVSSYGSGLAIINMGLVGIIATTYSLLLCGMINGPILAGIFTVSGFGAFGKHPKNIIPVLLGVFIANALNAIHPSSTVAVLSALFATTLAPIAGSYGIIAGLVAGFLHMAIVTNVSYLHGGINLYNNGFAGGFVAATMIPFLEFFDNIKEKR